MKKLKIILQHDFIYYLLLTIILISYFVSSALPHRTIYNSFNNEEFKITRITDKDYGIKLDLKGKEKVIGYLYLNKEEKSRFKTKYSLGEKILVTGERLDIENNTVPNTFNYKKYLYSNKIYNVIKIKEIRETNKKISIMYKVKDSLLKRTEKMKKSKAYIKTLVFGDSTEIDEDILGSYRENGISHLFAISGLHIAIFLYIINYCLDKLRVNNKIKNSTIVIFLIAYMFITNFAASVIRASIFTIFTIINKGFDLEIKPRNLLFLTLFTICIFNPLELNNIGLQYSFVVTLFLILFSRYIKGNYLKKLFLVSVVAFLSSFPITAYNFYTINLLSIIYNIIFVPFVSIIIIPSVLITYIFPIFDNLLFILIKVIENLSQSIEEINFFKITISKSMCIIYIAYYVAFCLIVCKRRNVFLKMFTIFIMFIIISNIKALTSGNEIIFFDVGQGDSVLINTKKEKVLIDTGGLAMYNNRKYTYKLSKNRTIPYLKSKGINKIDTLVLTHGDFDHMGEAEYIIQNFTVKRVIFNIGELNTLEKDLIKTLEEKNVKYYRNVNELKIDDTRFYFLNTRVYDNENDNSNVIYMEYKSKKFLFMGDASIEREEDILDKYNIRNIDVLKVGHHGSKTSSSKDFINEINPKYSIISVGKNNRYGHPNKEVLDNLKDSKIYRTDQDGSIMFKIKNNKLQIETCSP